MTERRLRVVSWRGIWERAFLRAVVEPFARSTGIEVELVPHVGLALPAGLESQLSRGNEPGLDVIWSNTTTALRAASAGYCESLAEVQGVEELDSRIALPESRPFAPAYVVHYVLVYSRAAFPKRPPDSWAALLDPRHAGKVVLYPGGKGFFPVAQLLGGGRVADIPSRMDACWSALEALAPQLTQPDYSVGLGASFRSGQVTLCYRALPNALGFRDEGADIDFVAPEEGVADTSDCLWIPRGLAAAQRELGQRFIAFALEPEVQSAWCHELGAVPLRRGAVTPSWLAHRGLPVGAAERDRVLHVPEAVEAEHELAWVSRFEELRLRHAMKDPTHATPAERSA